MPILRLTKEELDMTVACIDHVEAGYRLRELASPKHSGLIKTLKALSSNLKEQGRGNVRHLKESE